MNFAKRSMVLFTAVDLHFGAVDMHEAYRHFLKLAVPSQHLCYERSVGSVTMQASMQGATAGLGCYLEELPHEIAQR